MQIISYTSLAALENCDHKLRPERRRELSIPSLGQFNAAAPMYL